MITPGWRRRHDNCPQCHYTGRMEARQYSDDEMCFSKKVWKGVCVFYGTCDNCGVVYAFKADAASPVPPITRPVIPPTPKPTGMSLGISPSDGPDGKGYRICAKCFRLWFGGFSDGFLCSCGAPTEIA